MVVKYNKVEQQDNMNVDCEDDKVEPDVVREKVKRIVAVEPVKKKKGLFRRLWSGMVGPDGFRRIRLYVVQDIVVPSIKGMIADSIKSSVDMAFNIQKTPTIYGSKTQKVDYGARFQSAAAGPVVTNVRVPYEVDEYIIGERQEAIEVLGYLNDMAATYGSVAVAEYYDMLGIAPKFTDNNYGWDKNRMSKATITMLRNGEGYVIKFLPMEVL